jgi:hypothetical protein
MSVWVMSVGVGFAIGTSVAFVVMFFAGKL